MCSLEQQGLGSGLPLFPDMVFAWWFLLFHATSVPTWLKSLFPWICSRKPESCPFPHHCGSIPLCYGGSMCQGVDPTVLMQTQRPAEPLLVMPGSGSGDHISRKSTWTGLEYHTGNLYKHRPTQHLGELLLEGWVVLMSWLDATLCL